MTNQDKVNKFVDSIPHGRVRLLFNEETHNQLLAKITETTSLNDLIPLILYATVYSSSYREKEDGSKTVETMYHRRRSATDIWRHILFYRPETTIFDVMNAIWEVKQKLFTSFCSDIRRRVFVLGGTWLSAVHHRMEQPDEFGLTFSQWEGIHQEPQNKEAE